MLKKIILLVLILPSFLLILTGEANAFSVTQFGYCLNPQVTALQVNYSTDQNKHGVIGYPNQGFSGIDSIYQLENGNVMQCLCTEDGLGYQTTWLKAGNYSQTEIKTLQQEGWEYIIGGWGLEGAYLAKTATYSCTAISCTPTPTVSPKLTPAPESTPTLKLTPIETPAATSTPAPESTATPTPAPATQSSVAKLASTGNTALLYGVLLTGVTSLILGIALKKIK